MQRAAALFAALHGPAAAKAHAADALAQAMAVVDAAAWPLAVNRAFRACWRHVPCRCGGRGQQHC